MTTKTKLVRGNYKATEFQATERIVITPIQKQFIEKKFKTRAGVYIRRMIDELMIVTAAEGVKNEQQ
jgi:hypothetical protein